MPNKKTVRGSRGPTENERTLSGDLNDHLADFAWLLHYHAQESQHPVDIAVSQLLDAAMIAISRRESDANDPSYKALKRLDREAKRYCGTRTDGERWAFRALPPGLSAGQRDRGKAVKALGIRAKAAMVYVREERTELSARIAGFDLLVAVDELRLGMEPGASAEKTKAAAWRKLLQQLLGERPRPYHIAALALQCRGVPAKQATNWTRAAIMD